MRPSLVSARQVLRAPSLAVALEFFGRRMLLSLRPSSISHRGKSSSEITEEGVRWCGRVVRISEISWLSGHPGTCVLPSRRFRARDSYRGMASAMPMAVQNRMGFSRLKASCKAFWIRHALKACPDTNLLGFLQRPRQLFPFLDEGNVRGL